MLGVRRCPAWSALRESRAEWRALVRLRRESCEMEKKIQVSEDQLHSRTMAVETVPSRLKIHEFFKKFRKHLNIKF